MKILTVTGATNDEMQALQKKLGNSVIVVPFECKLTDIDSLTVNSETRDNTSFVDTVVYGTSHPQHNIEPMPK